MAPKHGTAEPTWRPLAKLSGLIGRRSSAKTRSFSDTSDEKSSIFGFNKRQNRVSKEITVDFTPLEVEPEALGSLALPEGWLNVDTESITHDAKLQPPVAASASITPIADYFSIRQVTEEPVISVKPQPAPLQNLESHFITRPYSMVETGSEARTRPSLDSPRTVADTQSIYSVLDRGRPIESRYPVSDLSRTAKSIRHTRPQESDIIPVQKETIQESTRPPKNPQSTVSKFTTLQPNVSSQRLPRESRTVVAPKRHSMYEEATSPTNPTFVKPERPPSVSRSVSATPTDRVPTWKRSGASVPTSVPSSVPALNNAGAPPSATPLVRRGSARGGVASNRLAWIRELEEKRASGVNRDVGVLKKQAGSVSDKLAMFESKKTLAAPTARLPPLTRSNSTSRFSSAGYESIFSADSNTATASPRTSIDTVRTTNRASSVMSHYDDSFREKLETLVSAPSNDKDKPNSSEKRRVSGGSTPAGSNKSADSSICQLEEDSEKDAREAAKEVVKEITAQGAKDAAKHTAESVTPDATPDVDQDATSSAASDTSKDIAEQVAEEPAENTASSKASIEAAQDPVEDAPEQDAKESAEEIAEPIVEESPQQDTHQDVSQSAEIITEEKNPEDDKPLEVEAEDVVEEVAPADTEVETKIVKEDIENHSTESAEEYVEQVVEQIVDKCAGGDAEKSVNIVIPEGPQEGAQEVAKEGAKLALEV